MNQVWSIGGENWREARFYGHILIPIFVLQFIATPLSSMFLIVEK
jgi:hypothetical protein